MIRLGVVACLLLATAGTARAGQFRGPSDATYFPTGVLLLPGETSKAEAPASTGRVRTIVPFDSDWQFLKSDSPRAENPTLDDSKWRTVNVPHDWSIEGPYDIDNPTGSAGAFLPAGIGWYRKHFTFDDYGPQVRTFIEFDGVMANSDVWINGFHLGNRPNGYVSFRYELTGHISPGPNLLAIRVDNSAQPASRWYSGAGIYRHVRLVVMAPVHLDLWGVTVITPEISPDSATVLVQSTLINQTDTAAKVIVQTTLYAPDGHPAQTGEITSTISTGQPVTVQEKLAVPNPQLWNPDSPHLYCASIKVIEDNKTVDDEIVPFGIREFHFDAATGFWMNGKNFKIKGVCLHVDGGAFGIAVPVAVWQRRLEALKQIGVNAIRTAHNPPAPEFLDLCDRMGFLVMDEMFDCWTVGKNEFDYHLYFNDCSKIDTADTVRRDRNHPSIILYSAGNEIHDTPHADLAKGILGGLLDVFHQNDPTRPVTQALFRPNRSHDYTDGLADMLDVLGQNYRENEILAAHQANPARKIIGTENHHDRLVWLALRDNSAFSGQFLWSGVDYLGEAKAWPGISRATGLLDRTGVPYPRGFQRQSWWSDSPMVRIVRRIAPEVVEPIDPGYEKAVHPSGDPHAQTTVADWSPAIPETDGEDIEVYSNCDEVELFLNGKSLGSQALPSDASARKWKVPFQPGVLKAVAKNNHAIAATDELKTAGSPAKIILTADSKTLGTGWDDVSYICASVTDDKGVQVPNAHDLISFTVTGPGTIAAVDNSDNSSHEAFQSNQRHAYQGQCFAIIRATAATGPITLTASASGLASASTTIQPSVAASLP